MNCREAEKLIGLYLDNEFSDADRIEIDEHISSCSRCKSIMEEETQLKQAISSIKLERAPAALRSRILRSLEGQKRKIWAFTGLKLAASLGVVVFSIIGVYSLIKPSISRDEKICTSTKNDSFVLAQASMENDTIRSNKFSPKYRKLRKRVINPRLMENLVVEHVRPGPVEKRSEDPDQLAEWYRGKTGLYTPPPKFASWGGGMVGGRLSQFAGNDAIKLIYSIHGRRVTLFMFNPRMMPGITEIKSPGIITKLDLDEILTETPGGRTVAVFSHNGTGYSLISDQEKDVIVSLIKSIASK
ncbi:MAG: zf-HC2 domain-containing protein [Deltaproteobacteria bacterium]|nr:zf-HC2 domain-containing protein [Deltaproteobacteria bacterium]